jgi:hypothetical protein
MAGAAVPAAARAAGGRAAAGKAAQSAGGGAGRAAAGGGTGGAAARPTWRKPKGGGLDPSDVLPASGGKGGGPSKTWRKRASSLSGTGPVATYRRALVAEFLVCVILLAFSPLAEDKGKTKPASIMKRGSATAALFVILGLMSSAGRGAARAAAAFGGLITLVLLIDQRGAFATMTKLLGADDSEDDDGTSGAGPDDGDLISDVVGDALDALPSTGEAAGGQL